MIGGSVELRDLVFDPGVADLEPFYFTEPAFAFGFDDPGFEVVLNFLEPVALRRVGTQ